MTVQKGKKIKDAIGKCLLLCLGLASLASCRLVITTDETGSIMSASGSHGCNQLSCAIPINGPFVDTFTAVPAEGYRFIRWEGVCMTSPRDVCRLALLPLPEEYSEYDGDVGLSAVFEPSSAKRAWYRDSDGDGYGNPERSKRAFERPAGFAINNKDCNDSDRAIHPWVLEKDDGQDNNCDGVIDEGFSDDSKEEESEGESSRTYYRDVDGDGFGVRSDTIDSVEAVDGYVKNDEDCDDNNAGIYPGAEEQFDSIDNDCDGSIDEGFSVRTWYSDLDGDGYGDESDMVQEVERPEGYVSNSRDNCVAISNPDQADSDRDGLGDACDSFTDSDRDEVRDSEDNCPGNFNPEQGDSDGDGVGDACDYHNGLDLDNDGVNNDGDNCPQNYNPNQSDVDEDGRGDACDTIDDRNSGGGGDNGSCSLSTEDQDMLATVNAVRAQARACGSEGYFPAAQPLAWNCKLEAAALAHSRDMADRNFFNHYGSNGSDPGYRITQAGYIWSTYGENIAAGLSLAPVGAVVQGWVDSDGHCANLMNPGFTELGAAKYNNNNSAYKLYWTQVFGRQR